jgi:hypothetical protein
MWMYLRCLPRGTDRVWLTQVGKDPVWVTGEEVLKPRLATFIGQGGADVDQVEPLVGEFPRADVGPPQGGVSRCQTDLFVKLAGHHTEWRCGHGQLLAIEAQ